MTATMGAERHPQDQGLVLHRRGGNRLRAGHPARGRAPRYQRRWSFPEDQERRDRGHRARFLKALHQAQAAGELPRHVAGFLWVISYRFADERGEGITASLATIARSVMGEGHYPAEDPLAGQRTARAWVAEAEALGWVETQHRVDHLSDGTWRGRTAVRRLCIPEPWRVLLEGQEDDARRRSAAKRSGPGRTTPRGTRPTDRSRPDEPTPSRQYRYLEEQRRAQEAAAGAPATPEQAREAIEAARAALRGGGDRSPP